MNKRDLVLSLLDDKNYPPYIPAAFFLHFDPGCRSGQAAIDKHLEFFRSTDMDFLKIQYEHSYPRLSGILKPADWAKMPRYGKDFFEEPLNVVKGLVKEAKRDALVLVTLYSPFMCSGHAVSPEIRDQNILENPEAVKLGMEAVTESVLTFVRECIRLGVDGFYASTQGAEAARFPDLSYFDACIRPYDIAVMEEINRKCLFNILHICDYHLSYRDITPFLTYPGHVVNCSLQLHDGQMTPRQVAEMFGRPFMGGMDRKGTLVTGTSEQIRSDVESAIETAPERFFLAADCTVPSDISWDRLRLAIDTAHARVR